ncbi:MAG: beta-glucuronidase [Planctomycetota bacterium]
MLYPQDSETREVKDLNGIWAFKADVDGVAARDAWHAAPLRDAGHMPVPASYNDITQDVRVRDLIGAAYYEREVRIPATWSARRIVLRFGAVTHHATVWLDGVEIARHKGGFLPFEIDITQRVEPAGVYRLTVAADNVLDWTCLPPGEIIDRSDPAHAPGYRVQEIHFDFFNYAGLHRPVRLLALPPVGIDAVRVRTDRDGDTGVVDYAVAVGDAALRVEVALEDATGAVVARSRGAEGRVRVDQARLWRPGAPYLYRLVCRAHDASGAVADVYRERVGIRSLSWGAEGVAINGEPFYFRGFGKHEDADLRGRGWDTVTAVKDCEILRWIGANSFRTAHYPYAEEMLRLADEYGLVVIDECPGVGMCKFRRDRLPIFTDDELTAGRRAHHVQVMRDLVARDANHPSVVMWSVANEAATWEAESADYFRAVIDATRAADATRPVMLVVHVQPGECHASGMADVIGINRYPGWYTDPGHTEFITRQFAAELAAWWERFGKPIVVTEYGADTVAGIHADPPTMFSEEYQCAMLAAMHAAFDANPHVIGEHVWNFADFRTKQGITRVDGNRKGVFTRDRRPKMAAHLLRERWTAHRAR